MELTLEMTPVSRLALVMAPVREPLAVSDEPPNSVMPMFADFRAEVVSFSSARAEARAAFSSLVCAEVRPVFSADSLYLFVSSATFCAALLYSEPSSVTTLLVLFCTLWMLCR